MSNKMSQSRERGAGAGQRTEFMKGRGKRGWHAPGGGGGGQSVSVRWERNG